MSRLLAALPLLLALPLVTGCTTVHGVGGGAVNGEFYVAAQKHFLIFSGAPYVVRCVEIRDPLGLQLDCRRVLSGAVLRQLNPSNKERVVVERVAVPE